MPIKQDIINEKQVLSSFISTLPEAIVICDSSGSILLHDSQSEIYLSRTADPGSQLSFMDGEPITAYIDSRLIDHALDEINEQLKEKSRHLASTFLFQEQNRVLKATIVPVLGQSGRFRGFVVILDDITRQTRAEKKVESFLRTLSKNARSPMASIRAAIEALRAFPGMDPERQGQFKEIIYNESIVLSDLLDRASEEYAGLHGTRMNINPMSLPDLLQTVRRRAGERFGTTCRIASQPVDERLCVMADPYQIVNALLFIMAQLIRETDSKEITLSSGSKGTIVFIDICRKGPPVSAPVLKRWEKQAIFSPGRNGQLTLGDVLNRHHSTIWAYENHDTVKKTHYIRWFIPAAGEQQAAPTFEPFQVLPESRVRIKDIQLFDRKGQAGELDSRLLTELSYTSLIREINKASRVEDVIGKQSQLPRLIHSMLTSGTKIRTVAWLVTAFSDAILQKLLAFAIEDIGPAPVEYAFVSLGSEGRKEQTLKTDQDNAIIFQDPGDEASIETVQQYFLRLGEKVCTWLDRAGFDFCKGNIMAMNPKWCRPLSAWKSYFSSWIREASPENLLHSSIFFDLRFAYGDERIVTDLLDHLDKHLKGQVLFFRVMAENAVSFVPPIGLFNRFLTESKGPHKHCIDIKKANQPIVDFAKIYALKHRVMETSTQDRLYRLYERRVLSQAQYNDIEQAYSFNMQMRFMGQVNAILGQHRKPDNHINPKHLSSIEKRTLKEVLKKVKGVQTRLRLDFIRE